MGGAELLESKRIPLARLAGALLIFGILVTSYVLLLNFKWRILEEALEGKGAGDLQHLLILPLLPLSAGLMLFLLIPLFIYVGNYSALQAFALPRPDHYVRLLIRVYSAWMSEGGKLKDKDL